MATVSPIPKGYSSVTPYLIVNEPEAALRFYAAAFGAVETLRLAGPDGWIAHCEFRIGNAHIMMGGESPDGRWKSPLALGGTSVSLMIYCEDCDAMHARALAAGATEIDAPADQFYGDRSGKVRCPFGHEWVIATHTEDLPQEEVLSRMMRSFGGENNLA
jgi:PhnB protein